MDRKYIIILGILAILTIVMPISSMPALGDTAWANTTFSYRINISISNTAGNQTNYPQKLTIDTQSMNNSGRLKTDCSDMEFYYYDNVTLTQTLLNAYNYSCSMASGINSTFWVNITAIGNASGDANTVYLYHSNGSYTTKSFNGTNTFERFQDFNYYDTSISLSGQPTGIWFNASGGRGGEQNIRVHNSTPYEGYAFVNNSAGDSVGVGINFTTATWKNMFVEVMVLKNDTGTDTNVEYRLYDTQSPDAGGGASIITSVGFRNSGGSNLISWRDQTVGWQDASTFTMNQWNSIRWEIFPNNSIKLYVRNNTVNASAVSSISTGVQTFTIGHGGSVPLRSFIDRLIIGKYIEGISVKVGTDQALNSAPAMNTSRIDPTPNAFANDTIRGYCQGTDADTGNSLTYNYTWYLNGTSNTTGNYSTPTAQGVEVNVNNLSMIKRKGQSWVLECLANDATVNSGYLNSTATVVRNYQPNVSLTSPGVTESTNDNTPSFNFTMTDYDTEDATSNTSLVICDVLINNTGDGTFVRSGRNATVFNNTATRIDSNATLSDNPYRWYISCNDGTNTTNTSQRNLGIDTLNPDIVWTTPAEANNTRLIANSITLNIQCSDTNLFRSNLTIRNSTHIIFANYSGDLNQSTYNWTNVVDLSNQSDSETFTTNVACADDHTKGPLKGLNFTTQDDNIFFKKDNISDIFNLSAGLENPAGKVAPMGNDLNISIGLANNTEYKWNISAKIPSSGFKLVILLESKYEIAYRSNVTGRNISGHFVIDGQYYTDFDDIAKMGNTISVEKLDVNKYMVRINGSWTAGQIVDLDPVAGGLNVQEENATFTKDLIQPSVRIDFPPNNTVQTSADVIVNFTATDTNNISVCYIQIDSGANTSISGCANTTTGSLSEGNHNITIWVNDTYGNSNSTRHNITVDTIAPAVNYESPTQNNNVFLRRNWIDVNITFNETNYRNTTFRLYNSTGGLLNTTVFNTTSQTIINYTSLSDGTYYYNATIQDMANRTTTASTRNITLDNVIPTITINQPLNNTLSLLANITVNYSASDSTSLISTCFIQIDSGTNSSISNCANTSTGIMAEGNHNITIWVNDSAGNSNSTRHNITVDTVVPQINYETPTAGNDAYYNRTWIDINTTYNETNAVNLTFRLYNITGGLINSTSRIGPNPSTIINFSSLSMGYYLYNVTIQDRANNTATTSTRNITLDNTTPLIENISSTVTSSTSTITWDTDDSSNSTVNYGSVDGNFSTSVADASNLTRHSIAISGLTASTIYFFNVSSCNRVGMCNSSLSQNFTTLATASSGNTIQSPFPLSITMGSYLRIYPTPFNFIDDINEINATIESTAGDVMTVLIDPDTNLIDAINITPNAIVLNPGGKAVVKITAKSKSMFKSYIGTVNFQTKYGTVKVDSAVRPPQILKIFGYDYIYENSLAMNKISIMLTTLSPYDIIRIKNIRDTPLSLTVYTDDSISGMLSILYKESLEPNEESEIKIYSLANSSFSGKLYVKFNPTIEIPISYEYIKDTKQVYLLSKLMELKLWEFGQLFVQSAFFDSFQIGKFAMMKGLAFLLILIVLFAIVKLGNYSVRWYHWIGVVAILSFVFAFV